MIMPRLADARGSRSPGASGTIAADMTARIDIVECQFSRRCCGSDVNGTTTNCSIEPPAVATPLLGRRLLAYGAEDRAEPRRRHANATDYFAQVR